MFGFIIFINGERIDVIVKPIKGDTRQSLNARATSMAQDIYRTRTGAPTSVSTIPSQFVPVGWVNPLPSHCTGE